MNKRPTLLTLIACYIIISSIVIIPNAFSTDRLYENILFAHFMTGYMLIAAILSIVIGVGILKYKEWARKMLIVLLIFGLTLLFLGPFTMRTKFFSNTIISFAHIFVNSTIVLLIIYYLNRNEIKNLFKKDRGQAL